jgi:hypothetical protein
MPSTITNDLSTPLLGNLSPHEGDADNDLLGNISQHEDYMYADYMYADYMYADYMYADYEYDEEEGKGCMSCSLKIVYDDEEESESEEDSISSGEDESSGRFDGLLAVSAALPFLLFLQFGMAFSSASEVDASTTTTGLSWSVVNYNIVLFVITASLYRLKVKASCTTLKCSALVLLPEIITNIVLSLVLFDKIFAAFWLLWSSMLCLVFLGLVFTLASSIDIRFKVVTKSSSSSVEDEDDEDEDELDASFSKGGRVRTTAQIV